MSWPGARESLVNSASSPMLISSFSGPSGRVGSAAWALWGVVSARAQVEAIEMGDVAFAPDFEYLVRKGDNRRSDFECCVLTSFILTSSTRSSESKCSGER